MRDGNFVGRAARALLVVLALVLVGLLAACAPGAGSLSQTPTPALPAPPEALITFKPAISYTAALQTITDLGLQPTDNCYPADQMWHPMGQQDGFVDSHALLVAPTVLAPQGWLTRARALPGFASAQTNVITSCPGIPAPVPTFSVPAPPEAQITFASTTSYADALAALVNLGVRLANPCYETDVSAGGHPAWQPMGQEAAFAYGQALIVAPTLLAPDDWLKQAQALSGVRAIQTPVVISCPAM